MGKEPYQQLYLEKDRNDHVYMRERERVETVPR